MKTRSTAALLALGLGALPALAQQFDATGMARTELVRHEYDATHEAAQVRVDFAPRAAFPRHSHPGVEIAHVLQGTIEYELDGRPVLLRTGDSLYIPAGAVHSARNAGSGNAAELATYIVEKNKPVVVLAKP